MKVASLLPSGSRTVSGVLVVLAFLFHCVLGVMLYYGRAVSHWPICDSDWVVFAAPLGIALAAYAAVLFPSPWRRPRSVLRGFELTAMCFILVFLSTWCYLFFAVNKYGS